MAAKARPLASWSLTLNWCIRSEAARTTFRPSTCGKIQGPEHIKTGGPIYYATRSYMEHTPYGHIGDPGLAKVETGEKGYDAIVDWLTQVIRRDFFDT